MLNDYIIAAIDFIKTLRTEHIALISIFVTFVIFIIGKRKENKLKIYETRKEHYKKLVDFFQSIFATIVSNKDQDVLVASKREEFFEMGSSLAIFGSRKLYKTYCFYRELAVNESIQKTKYFNNEMIIFVLGEMYKTMRKEIGLNRNSFSVDIPEILMFFMNDITKPDYRKKYYRYKYNKLVIKSLVLCNKIDTGLPAHWIYYCVLKPLSYFVFLLVYIPIKILFINSIKRVYAEVKELRGSNEN